MQRDLHGTVEELRVRADAQEFVLKILMNSLSQLAPNAGLHDAMLVMFRNSVNAATVSGTDEAYAESLRIRIRTSGEEIIEAAFSAKPAP